MFNNDAYGGGLTILSRRFGRLFPRPMAFQQAFRYDMRNDDTMGYIYGNIEYEAEPRSSFRVMVNISPHKPSVNAHKQVQELCNISITPIEFCPVTYPFRSQSFLR